VKCIRSQFLFDITGEGTVVPVSLEVNEQTKKALLKRKQRDVDESTAEYFRRVNNLSGTVFFFLVILTYSHCTFDDNTRKQLG